MPWYQKYVDDMQWQSFYKEEAQRRLGKVIVDWENCYAEAMSRLFLDKLPQATLSHDGNRDGYVASVYRRLLEDIRREHCGRPRPPAKMKVAGPPTLLIFDLFCLQKLKAEEISVRLDMAEKEVKHWTSWLGAERKCPENITMVSTHQSSSDGEYTLDIPDSDSEDPVGDDQVKLEHEALLELILEAGKPDSRLSGELSSGSREALSQLNKLVNLTDDDRLMFRLRFVEGLSRARTAKQLGMTTAKLAKLETSRLAQLRQALSSAGFTL